jgi:hypothetical protein
MHDHDRTISPGAAAFCRELHTASADARRVHIDEKRIDESNLTVHAMSSALKFSGSPVASGRLGENTNKRQDAAFQGEEMMESSSELLSSLCERGVRLWAENGQLRFQAPKGELLPEERNKLRTLKAEIIDLLEQAKSASDVPLEPRVAGYPVPLTFPQQMLWNALHPLGMTNRSTRSVPIAIRIYGRLNIESLRRSLDEVVRRHEALRTRIVMIDGSPMQEIDEAWGFELEVIDLTAAGSEIKEAEAKRLVEELVNEKIDVAVGPLFAARLLELSDQDHVLVVAMDHVISDGFSLDVLSRDIWTLYRQSVRGLPLSLPKVVIQLADYAVWQEKTSQRWMEKHGPYWKERLADAPRVRFPSDGDMGRVSRFKSGNAPIQFGKALTSKLRELTRRRRTMLAMTMLTAYVAVILRWQEKWELVLSFVVNGRHRSELENTIGFIASPLYLRVQMAENDTFFTLLERVTKEYYTAYDHYDFGRLSIPVPGPEFKRSTSFNWQTALPGNSNATSGGCAESDGPADVVEFKPFPCRNAAFDIDIEWDGDPEVLDGDPGVMLWDTIDGVVGDVWYRADRHKSSTMEQFARNFRLVAERVLEHPEARVATWSYE